MRARCLATDNVQGATVIDLLPILRSTGRLQVVEFGMESEQFRILIRRSGNRDTGFGRLAGMLRCSNPENSISILRDQYFGDKEAFRSFNLALKAFTFDSGSDLSFDDAVEIAGEDRVRKIALASAMLTTSPPLEHLLFFDLDASRRRCVTIAALLESLAQRYKESSAHLAFYTGLLMDSGYFVMIDHIPDDFQQVLFRVTSEKDGDVLETEREHLGLDHAQIGAVIADEFGFPEEVVMGIEFHHRPLDAPEEHRYWCSLCHLASWLVDNLGLRIASGMPEQKLVQQAFEEIKIDPDYEDHISASVRFAAGICDEAVRYLSAAA